MKRKIKQNKKDLFRSWTIKLSGKNYCINALKEKGLIKIGNFSESKNKIKYAYVLTPKGIAEKTKLTYNFLKRKMKEYEELQKELKKIKKNK